MSDKVLQVAKNEILRTIKTHYTEISDEDALRLSDELLEVIDWNNPALMHKSISWITRFYLQKRVVACA